MASKWFYSQDGVRRGPVSSTELRQLAREGVLKPQDLLWKEGMAEWLPASKTQKRTFMPTGSGVPRQAMTI